MTAGFVSRPNPALIEINTLAWLAQLGGEHKHLSLKDVPGQEWDRLKAMGMDWVWLMGVWRRSPEGRKISLNDASFRNLFDKILPGWKSDDVTGSPYAISAFEPDPLIGDWDALDYTRSELNKRGMGLVLDFIPNHTSFDHHWLGEHPEYYVQAPQEAFRRDPSSFFTVNYKNRKLYIAHGRDPYFPSWTDTAQLNYFNPELRQAMIRQLKQIAAHCDGLRCDVAMLVMNDIFERTWKHLTAPAGFQKPDLEFWPEAVREVPGPLYIAEAYWDTEYALQQMGFDYVYDKRLYDRLKSAGAPEIYLHLKADSGFQQKLLRFIENHDEERSLPAFGSRLRPAAAVASTLPGMRLYFMGQTQGKKLHQPVQIRRIRPEEADPAIEQFYGTLLKTTSRPLFHQGLWHLLEVFPLKGDSTAILAYSWRLDEEQALVIANFDSKPAAGRIVLEQGINPSERYMFGDTLSKKSFTVSRKGMTEKGLDFELEPLQVQIFIINPAADRE